MQAPLSSANPLQDVPAQTFRSLNGKLQPALLKALDSIGYEYMTPVQSKVLSKLPTLTTDCLVQAKTGTGKTTAFLLPSIQSLLSSSRALPRGKVGILILAPTRELAMQIAKECDQLTSCLPTPIECHTAYGGTGRNSNLQKFMKGSPSILAATPGRLKDYLSEAPTAAKFSNLRTLILDEADTMLEQGFLQDVKRILNMLPPKSTGWQGMCFSATVPDKIKDVLSVVLAPGYARISTIDKSEPPTHARVPQFHVIIPSVKDTFTALVSLVDFERREGGSDPKIIVFGSTARLVALYADIFRSMRKNFPLNVYELQSRMSQGARTRTTKDFKEAASGIMFATDVIGRGMDFPNVTSVIQVGLPMNGEQYVHRVGRTARIDRDGRAVILLTHAESFFLAANNKLPIQPYAHTIEINNNKQAILSLSPVMESMDEDTKKMAYSAYLGFMKGYMKQMGLTPDTLVAMANELALGGMECPETPLMEKLTIGRMGLKGVKGIRYATPFETGRMTEGKRPANPAPVGTGAGRSELRHKPAAKRPSVSESYGNEAQGQKNQFKRRAYLARIGGE